MKATIIEGIFGILVFDDKYNIVDKELFSKNARSVARLLSENEKGSKKKLVSRIIENLKKNGYEKFIFENEDLTEDISKDFNVEVEINRDTPTGKKYRSNTVKFVLETGFVDNKEEFKLWLHNLSMEKAKLKVRKAVENKDLLVAQAILTLDDFDKTINLFMSRVREWYGLHFPELDRLVDKQETYARLVYELGRRENFSISNLEKQDIPKSKIRTITKVLEASMGADLNDEDLTQIQELSRNVINLFHFRKNLEGYLDSTMDIVAPNLKTLAGSVIGARLISAAGGLINLAKRPSSTIQVLGAEKALFRALKTGAKPPKHGVIFQYSPLHESERWNRGKIARALAGKLAIASRVDAFGGRNIGTQLQADLERRIKEINAKPRKPQPIKKVEKKQRFRKRGNRRRNRYAGKR